MSAHQAMIDHLELNQKCLGQAILLTQTAGDLLFQGNLEESELILFLETVMRASPGFKDLIKKALEQSECPVS